MSVQTDAPKISVNIPSVQLNYEPPSMASDRNLYLDFAGMRSYTTIAPAKRIMKTFQRSSSNTNLMKCREFSFDDISSKPQLHGFRRGKVVENKQLNRYDSMDSLFFEDHQPKVDSPQKKTEDFSISGQKVDIKVCDPTGPKIIPPREWIIEKSRTLPVIGDGVVGPWPSPVTFHRPLKPNLKPEKLGVSMESLVVVDKEETKEKKADSFLAKPEPEPQKEADKIESIKNEESVTFPKIDDTRETPNGPPMSVTVSLQTDDYLYQPDNEARPTTSQNSRPTKYRPIKVITPLFPNKLPDLRENSDSQNRIKKRETPRISRKTFPTLRMARQPVSYSAAKAASANKHAMGSLSTSLPLLPISKNK